MEDSRDNAAIASKSTISNSVRFERFEGSRKSSMETFPTRMPMYIYTYMYTPVLLFSVSPTHQIYIERSLILFTRGAAELQKKIVALAILSRPLHRRITHCFIVLLFPAFKRYLSCRCEKGSIFDRGERTTLYTRNNSQFPGS